MHQTEPNHFQTFYEEDKYIHFKNYLYNYLLRKLAVAKNLQYERYDLILEVGSGISPMITRTDRIIYTDLSFSAIKILRREQRIGRYVVADAMNLPFKSAVFSHAVSLEVLEHLEDDQKALKNWPGP